MDVARQAVRQHAPGDAVAVQAARRTAQTQAQPNNSLNGRASTQMQNTSQAGHVYEAEGGMKGRGCNLVK